VRERRTSTRLGPTALTPTAAELYAAFASRTELRYELALDRIQLSAALVLEVAFARSHYDALADGARTRVATPWRARPGVALGVGTTL
jgi:hypothetical protein